MFINNNHMLHLHSEERDHSEVVEHTGNILGADLVIMMFLLCTMVVVMMVAMVMMMVMMVAVVTLLVVLTSCSISLL